MSTKSPEKDTSCLYIINQKLDVPLRKYLAYFNKNLLEIPKLKLGVGLQAPKQDVLFKSPFFNSISKYKLTSLDQFREKPQKYMI